MRKGWEIKNLGQICDIINGSTPLRTNKSFWEDGNFPWFTIDDIRDQGRIISNTKQKVTQSALKKLRVLPVDTILLCCTASIGEYAITKIELTTNQQFNGLVIKNKKEMYPKFLMYFSSTLKDTLSNLSGKTTIDFIPISRLKGIEIPLPPISEQQEIVSILDDTFESIERAKSNAEQNLKNAKELILSSTIKYFNNLDSVEFLNLEDLTDIITDYVANGSFASLAANVKYKREKDYAVLIRLLDNSRLYQGDFVYINKQAYEFLSKSKIYPNDIIISNVGARLGTVFRAPDIGMPMSLGPNSILIRSEVYGDYLFCWLASPSGQKAIKDIVAGAGQPKFNKTQFRKIQVPVPKDKKSQQIVIDNINKLTNKAEKLEGIYLQKIKYLEDLKKAVLQKAFNGELKTSKISA